MAGSTDPCRRGPDRRCGGSCHPALGHALTCVGAIFHVSVASWLWPESIAMEIAIVGLGRMGGNMARRLARAGVRVVGSDADNATRLALHRERVVEPADSARAMVAHLPPPRVVWLMVPAGTATEVMIEDVWPELARGDVIVDGGNAYYKDS